MEELKTDFSSINLDHLTVEAQDDILAQVYHHYVVMERLRQ